ncbi:hypothetical protein KKF45_05165 [Patescibacteria group bacterium]|nr:hypothetical protein [Patescibacteria group bacterium]
MPEEANDEDTQTTAVPEPITPPLEKTHTEAELKQRELDLRRQITKHTQRIRELESSVVSRADLDELHRKIDSQEDLMATLMDVVTQQSDLSTPAQPKSYRTQLEERRQSQAQKPQTQREPEGDPYVQMRWGQIQGLLDSVGMSFDDPSFDSAKQLPTIDEGYEAIKRIVNEKQSEKIAKDVERRTQKVLKDKGLLTVETASPTGRSQLSFTVSQLRNMSEEERFKRRQEIVEADREGRIDTTK